METLLLGVYQIFNNYLVHLIKHHHHGINV